ncbi:MAG: hypothetical protein V2A67_09045 [Bacteroidota bacterium]
MYRRCLFFILIGLMLNFNLANTQDSTRFKFVEDYRGDGMFAYNFFTGGDAADFTTSIKGFGSGLIDYFGSRASVDMVTFGSDKINLSLGVGLSVMKYRLSNHLIFTNPGGDEAIQYAADTDATHDYQDTFFGWGKSKIITIDAYFPLDLNIAIGKNLVLTAGPYADFNLSARYKMKYISGEDRVKELIRSKEFRKMNLSTFKYGVSAGLYHKKWKVGISGTYCLAPFFQTGLGPDLHEARVTASFVIANIKETLRQSIASKN